jgi:sn-glycerol 3-phosphate transport system permease protein
VSTVEPSGFEHIDPADLPFVERETPRLTKHRSPEASRRRRRIRRVGRYALLCVVAFVVLFPIYATVVVSLHSTADTITWPGSIWPTNPSLDAYGEVMSSDSMPRYLLNSFLVSVIIMVAQVVTSALAAYAFAYLRFPGRSLFFGLAIATLMVPAEVTVVANFELISDLGWIDTYQALTVPFAVSAFGIFLLRQTFLGLPDELREAARMDGYGHLGYLRHVALPLARPSLAALAVFSFLGAWNQYLWPLLVTNRNDLRTVQIGLRALDGGNVDALDVVAAGTVVAAIPVFLLLLAFQRQLVAGLTAGAVKG